MSALLIAAGILLLLATIVDLFWTILSTSGAGPMTHVISQAIWKLGTAIYQRDYGRRFLPMFGPASLLVPMLIWFALLWVGFFLFFSAYPEDVRVAQTGMPADVWERFYYTGFVIFTLSVGDVTAASDLYRVVTSLASIVGLFLVTLSITYLVPVLSAVTEKRAFACQIYSLGETPQDILINAWNGRDFSSISPYLRDLTEMISLHAQRHLSYPVLHHFQARTRRDAFPPQLATLSEAVLLLRYCVAPEHQADKLTLRTITCAIDEYIQVINSMYSHPERDEPPPWPDISKLRAAGVKLCTDEEIQQRIDNRADHRRMMLALVNSQAWSWRDAVTGTPKDHEEGEVG